MNARVLKLGVLAAVALALSACATHPYHEQEPHHYSKDRDGGRVACYATEAANEYECVPVVRRYPYRYDPYWDPYWPWVSFGLYYGWPHYYYYGHHHYYYPRSHPRPHPRPWGSVRQVPRKK